MAKQDKPEGALTGFELRPQNKDINRSLHYLEDHLDEDITVQMLAEISGYSYHHFCHLFKIGTGFSPKNYLIIRKLHRASQMLLDNVPFDIIVEKAGYGTAMDEFCRAFKKHFGVTTKQFVQRNGTMQIEPRITRLDARTVVGYRFDADDDANFGTCCYWQGKVFDPKLTEIYNKYDPMLHGECAFWTIPTDKKDTKPFYIYGTPVENVPLLNDGLTAVFVPAAEYAIFDVDPAITFADMCDNMKRTCQYITTIWLPSSEFYLDSKVPTLECYHGTEVSLCVPIRRFKAG